MNLAPPEEVDLWVKQGYLSLDEARRTFPFFAARLQAEKKAYVPVDWRII